MKKMLVAILAATMMLGILLLLPQSGYAAPIPVGPRANNYPDPPGGIYVSPTGNDATATGAIDKPYQSINAALTRAGAGGTVILRGGTYTLPANTEVRIVNPNVTLKSAQGEWAHIKLPFPANMKDQDRGESTVRFDQDAHGSKLQAVEVSGGFYAVVFNTTWDWGQPTRYGASNIIVEDCILHDARFEVVKVKPECNNITFRYNEIYNPARAEINDEAWSHGEAHAEAIDNVNGDNMMVQNNYMHDVNIAIYAKGGAADCTFENNRIEDCDGAGIVIGFDTSPDFFDLTVNPTYYESIRNTVRNNLIINTNWEGIGLYAAKDAQVYNNTLVNVARGYSGNGTFSQYIIHSALYFGIATQDWDNPAGCPPSINPSIHHNIVVQNASRNLPMIDIRYIASFDFTSYPPGPLSSLQGMPSMNNNCYFVSGKSAVFRDNRPSSTLASGNLGAWKTHIGGDVGSIEVNPAFDSNYLPTNSQCVGMGITDALVVTPGPVVPPVSYTVTYNAGGGTVSPTSATVTAGSSVTLPTPSRSGYTFTGWFTAASGGTKINSPFTPTGSITVYAQWTAVGPTQYTVTYNAGGGTVSPTSATVTAGSSVTLPTPSRSGYTFNGWFTSASGGTKINSPYTPTASITLYAQWITSAPTTTYTVTVSSVNVRALPRTAQPVFAVLKKGETVKVHILNHSTADGYTWAQIELADGRIGYVVCNYIAIPRTTTTYVVKMDSINVRAVPRTSYAVFATLTKAEKVQVRLLNHSAADGYTWAEIELPDGRIGYVVSTYLATSLPTTTYTVTVSSVNVRALPRTAQPVFAVLKKGETVKVHILNHSTADGYTWAQIELADGRIGYVVCNYIAIPRTTTTYVVKMDSINVRAVPRTSYAVFAVLKKGETVQVRLLNHSTADGYTWAEIELPDGRIGYVVSTYLAK